MNLNEKKINKLFVNWLYCSFTIVFLIIIVGGLTRLTDKRNVRRDIADIFCTNADGVRGKKALDWNLVDYIAPPSKFSDLINERVANLSKTVKHRNGKKGIKLNSLKRKIGNARPFFLSRNGDFSSSRPHHDHVVCFWMSSVV